MKLSNRKLFTLFMKEDKFFAWLVYFTWCICFITIVADIFYVYHHIKRH